MNYVQWSLDGYLNLALLFRVAALSELQPLCKFRYFCTMIRCQISKLNKLFTVGKYPIIAKFNCLHIKPSIEEQIETESKHCHESMKFKHANSTH